MWISGFQVAVCSDEVVVDFKLIVFLSKSRSVVINSLLLLLVSASDVWYPSILAGIWGRQSTSASLPPGLLDIGSETHVGYLVI